MHIQKRTIIAAIITIIVAASTYKAWFVYEPMQVDIKLSIPVKYQVQVLLNKKDNNDFIKEKHETVVVPAGKNQKITFRVKRSRYPKRLKFIFYTEKDSELLPIKLGNITLKKGEYKLEKLNSFTAKNASLKIENNTLIIAPQDSYFEILYNEPLNVSTVIRFEFEILVIIIILTFLLSYKLTNYLAEFSTIKNKSRIDIIFLTIFFTMLFIPMSHINYDEISKDENRLLEKMSPFITEYGEINYDFGKNFESWFNDRFFLRKFLMELKYVVFADRETSRVIIAKDGWLFYKADKSIRNYQNDLCTQEELEKAANYLISINNYCKKHNKKFYFIVAPDKNKIYGEYFPDYYKKFRPDSESRFFQFKKYLEANSDIKVIYLYDALIKNKDKGLLYWKHDTHWNSFGAYIGYKEITKQLIADGIKIKTVNFDNCISKELETKHQDLAFMLPELMRKPDKTQYLTVHAGKDSYIERTVPTEKNPWQLISTHNKIIKTPKVYAYRDSFSENLIPLLSNTFQDITYNWTKQATADEIQDADIVIFETVERYVPDVLAELTFEENK